MKFTLERELSVRPPYRLDLTADALRRLASNAVDLVEDGVYRRALADGRGTSVLAVSQVDARTLLVRASGKNAARWIPVAESMLGTSTQVRGWERRAAAFPWLARLARALRGLRPPRYPTLWEALAHAIVFQQISIHAAAAIMRRLVEALSEPLAADGRVLFPFFTPAALLGAREAPLKSAGLSENKARHLRAAAEAILAGAIDRETLALLPSAQAAERLQTVRGIGPWSAAVVLLRGLGRMDVFPMKDSGVARGLRVLSGDPGVDADAVLAALGPVRGFLYYHLLLGRMRNLGGTMPDSGER